MVSGGGGNPDQHVPPHFMVRGESPPPPYHPPMSLPSPQIRTEEEPEEVMVVEEKIVVEVVPDEKETGKKKKKRRNHHGRRSRKSQQAPPQLGRSSAPTGLPTGGLPKPPQPQPQATDRRVVETQRRQVRPAVAYGTPSRKPTPAYTPGPPEAVRWQGSYRAGVGWPTPSSGPPTQTCPAQFCGEKVGNVEAHVLERHVAPAFRDLEGDHSRVATLRRVASLRALFLAMGGEELVLNLLTTLGLPDVDLFPIQQSILEVCREGGWPIPARFSLSPITTPAVLVHWRAQVMLMDLMGEEKRRQFLSPVSPPKGTAGASQPPQGDPQGNATPVVRQKTPFQPGPPLFSPQSSQPPTQFPSSIPPARSDPVGLMDIQFPDRVAQRLAELYPNDLKEGYDSHCHYDRAIVKMKTPSVTLGGFLRAQLPVPPRNPIKLAGGMVIYCDPPTWPNPCHIPMEQGWGIAVGLHPKRVRQFGDVENAKLERLMACPEVKALGEVGLDRSVSRDLWARQETTLAWTRSANKSGKPLILHLRGERGDPTAAEVHRRALEIVGERCRSQAQAVHLHCFCGGPEQVRSWLAKFPNTYFGFTLEVRRFVREQLRALASLDSSRILLESDSPYFPPPGAEHGHPQYLWEVAAAVGEVRGVGPARVLAESCRSGAALYG